MTIPKQSVRLKGIPDKFAINLLGENPIIFAILLATLIKAMGLNPINDSKGKIMTSVFRTLSSPRVEDQK